MVTDWCDLKNVRNADFLSNFLIFFILPAVFHVIIGRYRKRSLLDLKTDDQRTWDTLRSVNTRYVPKLRIKCVGGNSGLLKRYRYKQIKRIDSYISQTVREGTCYS